VTGGSAMLARVVAFGFASRCLADEVLPELIQVGDVVASSHSSRRAGNALDAIRREQKKGRPIATFGR
jgi:hypothetical protein